MCSDNKAQLTFDYYIRFVCGFVVFFRLNLSTDEQRTNEHDFKRHWAFKRQNHFPRIITLQTMTCFVTKQTKFSSLLLHFTIDSSSRYQLQSLKLYSYPYPTVLQYQGNTRSRVSLLQQKHCQLN